MKSTAVLFWILTVYFVLIAAVYTAWSLIWNNHVEWVGSVAILLSGGLAAFIATYITLAKRKQGGELVEDRLDSDIDDGDPELGEFSPWSWWPILLAFAAGLFVIGLSIGGDFWLSFISLPLVPVAIVGWVYEYYRGHFAR